MVEVALGVGPAAAKLLLLSPEWVLKLWLLLLLLIPSLQQDLALLLFILNLLVFVYVLGEVPHILGRVSLTRLRGLLDSLRGLLSSLLPELGEWSHFGIPASQ